MQRIMSISNSCGRFSTLAHGSSDGISPGVILIALVGDESGRAAVVFGEMFVPALLGELHGHAEAGGGKAFAAGGFSAQRFERVGQGENETLDQCSKIDFLTEVEFRALEFDDGHLVI